MAENQQNSHQKTGAILLALFGVLVVVFGVLQLRNAVYGPYALKNTLPSNLKQNIIDDNIAYQRQLDTDRDTLSDFDEQGVYGTSPYLYDTFGYGMSDAEVVKRGLALCPNAGKNCTSAGSTATSSLTASSTLISSFEPPSSPLSPAVDLDAILKDPKQLRQILSQSGQIDAKTLNSISDQDLLKTAQFLSASTSLGIGAATSTPRPKN